MMSIMEKLIGQVLIPEEYIIILTILPLVVISALLAYYYIHSTLQFAPHKRSYINLKSDSSLAILKYIESIDLLDQCYFSETQKESRGQKNNKSRQKKYSSSKEQENFSQVQVRTNEKSYKKGQHNSRREVKKNKRANNYGKHRNTDGLQNQADFYMLPIIEEQAQY